MYVIASRSGDPKRFELPKERRSPPRGVRRLDEPGVEVSSTCSLIIGRSVSKCTLTPKASERLFDRSMVIDPVLEVVEWPQLSSDEPSLSSSTEVSPPCGDEKELNSSVTSDWSTLTNRF